jgi:hypothetical protein
VNSGPPVATRAVFYLGLFPTALFFLTAYSEGLYLACTVGCVSACRFPSMCRGPSLLVRLVRHHSFMAPMVCSNQKETDEAAGTQGYSRWAC